MSEVMTCMPFEQLMNLSLIHIFPVSEYEKMDVVKKQQALMDGVVLEESTLPEASVDADNENIQYLSLIHIL